MPIIHYAFDQRSMDPTLSKPAFMGSYIFHGRGRQGFCICVFNEAAAPVQPAYRADRPDDGDCAKSDAVSLDDPIAVLHAMDQAHPAWCG